MLFGSGGRHAAIFARNFCPSNTVCFNSRLAALASSWRLRNVAPRSGAQPVTLKCVVLSGSGRVRNG